MGCGARAGAMTANTTGDMVARVRNRLSWIGAALVVVLALLAPVNSAPVAAQAELQPIPDMYVGTWSHHGIGISITRSDTFPQAGSAIAQWRTYTWCQDALSGNRNPPPCDMMVGNLIANGGIASILLTHPRGQDDSTLSGVVAATSDANGFGDAGTDVEFAMLSGNMLQITLHGQPTLFCGDNTDLSQYPPSPCGA